MPTLDVSVSNPQVDLCDLVSHPKIHQAVIHITNMEDIRYIAYNLEKTGMSAEKIATILEIDAHIVNRWLDNAGIDPRDYKGAAYKRQMDGIAAAKANGIKFGRPRVEPPKNFSKIMEALDHDLITTKDAIRRSGMAEATFYRRRREYRENKMKD